MTGVFLVLLGIGIHFLGFRIALQVRPQLARVMGDVITADEQNTIELEHQKKLDRLTQAQTVALAQREKKQKEIIASYEHQLELMHTDFKETSMQFSREKKEIDALYRKKLETLNQQMTAMTSKIGELNSLKERLATLAAPAPIKNKMSDPSSRGGPLIPLKFQSTPNAYLDDELDQPLPKYRRSIQP